MVTTIYWTQHRRATLHVGDARDVLAAHARRLGRLHRHQPALLGQARLRRRRPVRPRSQPRPPTSPPCAPCSREARRVLADDGTCWLNLGDSYSAGSGGARPACTPTSARTWPAGSTPGMAAKNLLGLPWRVALALQDDGWILRNAIVWHKPNAMPESVRDRLNCRHELIFLLVKSRRLLVRPRPHPHPARHAGRRRSRRPPAADAAGRRRATPARRPAG